MLRITVSKGGQSAVKYFRDALSKQDYYSEKAKVMGTWHGKTATRIGLPDVVTENAFELIVKNRNPITWEKITPRDAANRRAGYDFTFNAPKSVSIVEALTKDEAIRLAHRTAIQKAMEEVEENIQVQAGRGKDKHYETTGNIIYASFEHDTTRPVAQQVEGKKQYLPDMHLHTHCFVMNATWNEKKDRYQAIEVGNIKKNAPYYEALYHSYLAQELQKAGYDIERTKSAFEIKGISRETIEKFSNRTLEIEKLAEEKGLDWAEDKAALGAKTRHRKNQGIDGPKVDQLWSERLTLTERFAIHSAKGAYRGLAVEKDNSDAISPKTALDMALEHHMERKSAVTEKQVLAYALKQGIDRLNPEDVKAELDKRKGQSVFTGPKNSDTYIATKEALMAEEQMKAFAVSTRAKFRGINPDFKSQKDFLNEGQKGAINHALNSKDQVILIAGGAGVGKTTLMKEVKTGVEESGKKLFAFAPSADASRGVLRSKNFEGADTIKKLLDDQRLQQQLKDQVLLIDEAGMVGTKTMNSIFEVAKKQSARVILSGDWKQHNSVQAGDALRLLETHTELPVARVNEIVRQREKSAYKEAVGLLSEGDFNKGFDRLDRMNSIIEIEEQPERHQRIAKDYLQSIQAPPVRERDGKYHARTAIVVSPTHAEGRAITSAIRNKLKEEGVVAQQEHSYHVLRNLSLTEAEKKDHLNYQPGMAIQFHKTYRQFKAGNSYDVVEIAKDGTVMVQDAGANAPTALPFKQSKKYQVCQKETIAISEGDKLRITGNGKTISGKQLNNGESYSIKSFTEDGQFELNDGKVLPKDYKNFTLGYYRTSHSSQGKDAHDVLIAQSSTSFGASNEKQFYVSVSRGVERCFIYTNDKAALKWAASQNSDRMSAAEVVNARLLQQQQAIQYQKDVANYQSSKSSKEQSYERDIRILPSRSGGELHPEL